MRFTGLTLKNYKSIKNLTINLNKNLNEAKKEIAIYGENGAGKSSIVGTLMNLSLSLLTMDSFNKKADILANLSKSQQNNNASFIELSNEYSHINFFEQSKNIKTIFKDTHMINEKENTKIIYDFILDGKRGEYEIELDNNNELVKERLEYLISKRRGLLFEIKKDSKTNQVNDYYNKALIKDKKIRDELYKEVRRFWGQHSFLSIIDFIFNSDNYEKEYLTANVSSNLIKVIHGFKNISFHKSNLIISKNGIMSKSSGYKTILNNFSRGIIKNTKENINIIENTQKILNEILPNLNSNILFVNYKLEKLNINNNYLKYELVLNRLINGSKKSIRYDLESDGTKNVIELLPFLLDAIDGKVVVVDEIANEIHDLLIQKIISEVNKNISGQLIFTTHDTLLMKKLNKYSVYLINVDPSGNREVYSLDEFPSVKDNKHQNKTNEYLNGKFEAIPYVDDIDFNYIKSIIKEDDCYE